MFKLTCFRWANLSINPDLAQKALTLSRNEYEGKKTTTPSGIKVIIEFKTDPSSVNYSVSCADLDRGQRGRTISSLPRVENLNSKSTFLGPIVTTCVNKFSFGITCRHDNVVIFSLGIAGKSCRKKSDIGSIVPPANMTLRAEVMTSLNRSAGFKSIYLRMTVSFSSREMRTRPSSLASTKERRNDSTR
jgi:hypothetical protein